MKDEKVQASRNSGVHCTQQSCTREKNQTHRVYALSLIEPDTSFVCTLPSSSTSSLFCISPTTTFFPTFRLVCLRPFAALHSVAVRTENLSLLNFSLLASDIKWHARPTNRVIHSVFNRSLTPPHRDLKTKKPATPYPLPITSCTPTIYTISSAHHD